MKTTPVIFLCFFALYVLVPNKVLSFEYFDKSIDYWDLKKRKGKKSQPVHSQSKLKSQPPRPKDFQNTRKFNWGTYLNPQTTDDLKDVFLDRISHKTSVAVCQANWPQTVGESPMK